MNEIITSIPIREQIVNIIREMIISGELQNDQKISERQISMMLNVSTTPVKEAFRTLQAEGLIYSIPRKGSFVSSYSKENIRQVVYLRSSIDGVAAYFAAKCASEDEIREMSAALQKSRRLIENKENPKEITLSNNCFHETVRQATHNSYIVNMGTTIRSIDNSVRNISNRADYGSMMERQMEHEEILDAIIKRESEKAEQIMRKHIRQNVDIII